MSYNNLSPAEIERLALLIEDAGKVVAVAGKAIREGYRPPSMYNNREELEEKLGNLGYAIHLMVANGDLCSEKMEESLDIREENISNYLHEQETE